MRTGDGGSVESRVVVYKCSTCPFASLDPAAAKAHLQKERRGRCGDSQWRHEIIATRKLGLPEVTAKLLSIRLLKRWAAEHLPSTSKLRALILAENETMATEVFLAKWSSWELLLKEEASPE